MRSRTRGLECLAWAAAWGCGALWAQTPSVVIKARTQTVQIAVSVTHQGTGEIVEGLSARDFAIKDNGKSRKISNCFHGETRGNLILWFLAETSSSQVDAVNGLRDALPEAISALRPADRVGIASVFPGHHVELAPTTDRSAVSPALEGVQQAQRRYLEQLKSPDKQSRPKFNFDDLGSALVTLSSQDKPRLRAGDQQVLVIVSDDFDLLNPKLSADAARALVRAGTTVATFIDLRNPGIVAAKRIVQVMRWTTPMRFGLRDQGASYFANETGGPIVRVTGGDYLSAVQRLLRVISGAYLVGFEPAEQELDGAFHKLSVSLLKKTAPGGTIAVHYRRGYWAEP